MQHKKTTTKGKAHKKSAHKNTKQLKNKNTQKQALTDMLINDNCNKAKQKKTHKLQTNNKKCENTNIKTKIQIINRGEKNNTHTHKQTQKSA